MDKAIKLAYSWLIADHIMADMQRQIAVVCLPRSLISLFINGKMSHSIHILFIILKE